MFTSAAAMERRPRRTRCDRTMNALGAPALWVRFATPHHNHHRRAAQAPPTGLPRTHLCARRGLNGAPPLASPERHPWPPPRVRDTLVPVRFTREHHRTSPASSAVPPMSSPQSLTASLAPPWSTGAPRRRAPVKFYPCGRRNGEKGEEIVATKLSASGPVVEPGIRADASERSRGGTR
jgi:hypothetical protein